MRYLILSLLLLTSCGRAYILTPMLENARCACKNNGGLSNIVVEACPGSWCTDKFNFICNDNLETGWWSAGGSMATEKKYE